MEYRELGKKTGIRVSAIGFGGWAIGGASEASGAPLGWGKQSDEDSMAAIRRARELGITFFDTADSYGFGRSESLLGIVLSRYRQDVVIATKVGVVRTGTGALKKDFSRQHIFHAVDGSLKRLRTDYIDLYQMHNPTIEDLRHEDIQDAMERLQDAGKIRFWGVSVSTPEEGIEIMQRGWAHALQVLYNVLNQAPAQVLFPTAKEKGYGIIARVPLASGLLTGKFRIDSVFPSDDLRQNFLTPRRLQEAIERVDETKSIIGGASRSLAEGALRFVLANEAVSTTIPGARNSRQVETNAAAIEGTLAADIVEKLRTRLGDYNFYQRHGIRL
ncbi:MAG TPA: aldo/keto reductase [Thermoanaerobaculia bacterium]|jgi:aryl-alcohol dehydrogenase-like predicted oxidoreductase